MKKHYILTLLLSVILVAVTLSYKSTKVVVENASTIEIENELPVVENVETNVVVKPKEEIIEQPKTVVLEGKTISTKDAKSDKQEYIVASRGGEIKEPKEYKEFILSHYSELKVENGGYDVTCEGIKLKDSVNIVASNFYPLGTMIYLEGYGTYRVGDHGGSSFNKPNRLDVLVLRKQGESLSTYRQRIREMGKKTVKGYIVK